MKLLTRAGAAAVLIALAGAAAAETRVDPAREAAWETRVEAAKAKVEQAAAQKSEALERYQARKRACFEKFQVSACQNEAKRDYNKIVLESEHLSNEGKAEERQVRREQLADKDARHAIDAADAARQLPEREADIAHRRDEAEAKRAEKLQKQAQHAEEGERRRREREARVARKQAEHAAEVARRVEQATPAAPPAH